MLILLLKRPLDSRGMNRIVNLTFQGVLMMFQGTLHYRGINRVVKLTIQVATRHDGLIVGLLALHFATVQAGDDGPLDGALLEPFTAASRIFAAETRAAMIARLGRLVLVRMRGEFGCSYEVVGRD